MKALVILILFLSSCHVVTEESAHPESRIQFKEVNSNGSGGYYIIEVDEHEYLFSYYGGGVHLQSCKCVNK